jgi:hypothetical protein
LSKPERNAPGDGGAGDAAPAGGCLDAACSAAGGVCAADGFCLIQATDPLATPRCPSGMRCSVECTGDGCESGVDCAGATECRVRCDGDNACSKEGVDCGTAATCTVFCVGANACKESKSQEHSVECRDAQCTVTCVGDNACDRGVGVGSGTCTAHCCDGGCKGGVDGCGTDALCS